jgi:hypothetical protein
LKYRIIGEIDSLVMQTGQRTDLLEHRIQQQKLIRYWQHSSAGKTGSLLATQFGKENWFVADSTIQQRN